MDLGGAVHPIIGIIDHGSRLALALRPLPDRTAVTVLKALLMAIDTFGMPSTIKTDNDAVFTVSVGSAFRLPTIRLYTFASSVNFFHMRNLIAIR